MKRFVAVLMCVFMLFSLTACSGSIDEDVVGKWTVRLDLSDLPESGADSSLPEESHMYLVLDMEINADGTYTMGIDEEATLETVETYLEATTEKEIEEGYAYFEGEGFSREEVDDYYVETYGMTYEASVRSHGMTVRDYELLFASSVVSDTGYCKTEDGTISFSVTKDGLKNPSTTFGYTIIQGDLYITTAEGNGWMVVDYLVESGFPLPVVFTKE